MRVGTLPWLLHHEWRLWCRHKSGLPYLISISKRLFGILLLYGVGLIAVGLFKGDLNYPLQYLLRNLPQNADAALWMAVAAWFWMFYFSFLESARHLEATLTQSPNLTPLVSSPLSPKSLFATKFFRTAVAALLRNAPLFIACSLIYWPSLRFFVGVVITSILLTVQCTSLVLWLMLWVTRGWGVRRAYGITIIGQLYSF